MDFSLFPVTIQQIQIFLQVVECRGFAKAGVELHMTQSAVSKSVAKLEQTLGITLFARTTRNLDLTASGELLYSEWKLHLEELYRSYYKARNFQESSTATLHIGLLNTAHPSRYYWELEKNFRQNYPDVSIRLESEYMTDLVIKLAANIYDLIMIPDFERFSLEERGLSWKWAARSNACIVIPVNHPLAKKETVCLQDILDCNFISLHGAQTSNYVKDLTGRFQTCQAAPKLNYNYNNAYDIQYLYQPEDCILFTDIYFDRMEDPDSVKIPVTDQQNGIICGYQPGSKNPCVQQFLDLLPPYC